jgi:hypothetical protein
MSTKIPATNDDFKDTSIKHNMSKFDYDLYCDDDNIPQKILRVKRFSLPNKGERWKFFDNTKVDFILEGDKLSDNERIFLRTVEGVNFLLTQYKNGNITLESLKKELDLRLK